MKKNVSLVSLFVFGVSLAFAAQTVMAEEAPAEAPAKCVSKQELPLVKAACEKGGQKAAKKAMKSWVKKVKAAKKAAGETEFKFNCKTCHSKMKDDFALKDNAYADFKKLDEWLKKQSAAEPKVGDRVLAWQSSR